MDANGDVIKINSYTQTLNGRLLQNTDGTFIYTPNKDFFGEDSFSYTIIDERGLKSGTANVILNIESVNDSPIANYESKIQFTEDIQINTYTNSYQSNSALSSFEDGGYIIAWESNGQDGSGDGIFYQRYNKNGEKVDQETLVNSYVKNAQRGAAVATLADGGYVITWYSELQEANATEIYAQQYKNNGERLGSEFRVNTYINNYQFSPKISALNDGGYIIVWYSMGQDSDNSDGIYAQRYDSNGNKKGSETKINTYTIDSQISPCVTSLNDGGYVISWQSNGQDGSAQGIFLQRYDVNGNKLGIETQVNTHTNSSQASPTIASLNDGGYVVSWTSYGQDGNSYGIFLQRYDVNGNKVGIETQVNTNTYDSQTSTKITSLNDGGYVITWQSYEQDGNSFGIFLQRYDVNGNKVGIETQVNTHTNSSQASPTITSLNDGGYIIVWQSNGQDGDNYGIYAKRFDKNGEIYSSGLFETTKDSEIIIDVLANDYDPDGDDIYIKEVGKVLVGEIEVGSTEIINLNGKQQVKFTPNDNLYYLKENEKISVQISYVIEDSEGNSASSGITLDIKGSFNSNIIYTNTNNEIFNNLDENNIYVFNKGGGEDIFIDSIGSDQIRFSSDITKSDITILKDLEQNILIQYSQNDKLLIKSDFNDDKIILSNGNYLTNNDINNIIQQMNAYAQNNGIDMTNTESVRNNENLMTIIQNSWKVA